MKKNVIFLALLLISLINNNALARNTSDNALWQGIGAAVTAVAAGVAGYKLAEWFFSETDDQLIDRARREYRQALQYSDTIEFLENSYTLSMSHVLSAYDKNIVLNTFNEPTVYAVARSLFDRGTYTCSYMHKVFAAQNQLTALSQELHKRVVTERSRPKHSAQTMMTVKREIDAYNDHLTLLADYMSQHKHYFKVFDVEADIYKNYDAELRIIRSNISHYTMTHDIRQSVLWNYNEKKYPYIAFTSRIGDDISSLRSALRHLSHRYVDRYQYAQWLLESLEWIQKAITSDARYTAEKYQAEQERLERIRIETLQEKNRIERMQLHAQQEQNYLLAQNNRLQAQRIVQNDVANNAPKVTVVLHA